MNRIALMCACVCLASTAMAAGNDFNPDISLILQGRYVDMDRDAGGFPAGFFPASGAHDDEGDGHEHGAAGRGFSLDHSELILSANIDHALFGLATLAIEDDAVEVEEAWFQTTGLGYGLSIKGGRFFSQIGYINEQHAHAWDFADQSFVYRAMFGGQLTHDGAQVRWLAPTPVFLEFGIEAARGQFFPGTDDEDRSGVGTKAAFVHLGDDLGISNSWRAGLSWIEASPRDRHAHVHDAADVETEVAFSGKSRIWVADLVWKWAPGGDMRHRYLKFQAEYMHRRERGELGCEDNMAEGGLCEEGSEHWRSSQSGFYAQAVYQFMPRWRVGYRYDRLNPGSLAADAVIAAWLHSDHDPERHTVMLDFSPSEFSRLRFQLARDEATEERETIATVQYIMSLGAHGAHKF